MNPHESCLSITMSLFVIWLCLHPIKGSSLFPQSLSLGRPCNLFSPIEYERVTLCEAMLYAPQQSHFSSPGTASECKEAQSGTLSMQDSVQKERLRVLCPGGPSPSWLLNWMLLLEWAQKDEQNYPPPTELWETSSCSSTSLNFEVICSMAKVNETTEKTEAQIGKMFKLEDCRARSEFRISDS